MKTCTSCNKSLLEDQFYPKYKQCKACKALKADERRARLKEAGICPRCQRVTSGGVMCGKCKEYNKRWYLENYSFSKETLRREEIKRKTPKGMQYCSSCKEYLSIDDFYEYRNDPRKLSHCKKCKRATTARRHIRLKKERKCTKCEKPLLEKDKRLCTSCKNLARENYHQNVEYSRAIGRERKRKLRMEAFNAYGGPVCACCGDTHIEFLTFDHIEGDGAKHRRKLKREFGYIPSLDGWLKKNGYPPGYRILCMNCNCSLAHHGYCPHEIDKAKAKEKMHK